ncbi:hypothetical protein BDK51DRAFT_16387 [Blyttiomyces helicus]|uniref:Uncharacterized protein n=1 Tax=Blyttiomyces helicus TaxID=388810 RepID=A0A4P9WEC2_9FUNG|nr:hypothetical protein BDK51DRAFT_16387 [Blyttiomyces helicus]|eukprot:RKO90742.1 hypothetical protein BDK51DRAFT_16387 [Blyttiomyces helicus]
MIPRLPSQLPSRNRRPGRIINAYTSTNDSSDLENGLGINLLSWGIFTFLMLISAHRSNVALVSLFASLFITLMLPVFGKFNAASTSRRPVVVLEAILFARHWWFAAEGGGGGCRI